MARGFTASMLLRIHVYILFVNIIADRNCMCWLNRERIYLIHSKIKRKKKNNENSKWLTVATGFFLRSRRYTALFFFCALCYVLMARILLLFVFEFKIKTMNHYFMTDASYVQFSMGSMNSDNVWNKKATNRQHVTICEYVRASLCYRTPSAVSSKIVQMYLF